MQENDNGDSFRPCLSSLHIIPTNTFVSSHPTWFGTKGHQHRIDYVCLSASLALSLQQVHVASEVDIASAKRRDNVPFSADPLSVEASADQINSALTKQADPMRKISKLALQDPGKVHRCRIDLWHFYNNKNDTCSNSPDDVDLCMQSWSEGARSLAVQISNTTKAEPRKK